MENLSKQINVLLIGSGGREHAIAETLIRTSRVSNQIDNNSINLGELYISPGNPGTNQIAKNINLDINPTNNHKEIIEFCINKNIKLVIVGPEVPLVNGIADDLINAGINCFGPKLYPAKLEASKGFAKDFMKKYDIPTAKYQSFEKSQKIEAIEYIKTLAHPIVIKADGLAAGKGVIISESIDISITSIEDIFSGAFGESGNNIVIEEFMTGEEASIFAICDGHDYVLLHSAQDHKRIYDGDKGKNTGGMGAYSPAPVVNDKVLDLVRTQIVDKVISGLISEYHNFVGCLFVGLMIENDYPKVVEFNCRFGDPETQSVLTLFEGNLLELFYSCSIGKINKNSFNYNNIYSSCTVILASDGYPDNFEKGNIITGIENANSLKNTKVFFAGVSEKDGNYVNSGGRVLAVTSIGNDLSEAINKSYAGVNEINFSNKFFRKDIGQKGLAKSSILK